MTAFRIVVPAFRAGPWIARTVRSIRRQRHTRFTCLVLDDASPDDTYERAVRAAAGDARIRVERTPERRGAMANWVAGIAAVLEDDDDVIVNVDGDDWLAHDRVLERLSGVYADPEVWLTYGSHRRWKDKLLHRLGLKVRRGIARPYPDAVLQARDFREHEFVATHLRTFRGFLWKAIQDEDLREASGRYVQTACDLAFMFPMLEMAGAEHVCYLHEMLYVYNNSNPLNDHRSRPAEQIAAAARLRALPRYALLARPSGPQRAGEDGP
jgi:glycosyltransferase involved in cell wall biosynthesis